MQILIVALFSVNINIFGRQTAMVENAFVAKKLKKVQNFLPHILLCSRGGLTKILQSEPSLCKCPVPALSQFRPLNRPPISPETAWNNTPHFSNQQSSFTNNLIFTICQEYTCLTCLQYIYLYGFVVGEWVTHSAACVLCLPKNSQKLA